MNKALSTTGEHVSTTSDFVGVLSALTAGIPNYVQQFCYDAFEADTDGTLGVNDLMHGAEGTKERRGSFQTLWEKHFQSRYTTDISSDYKRKILHCLTLFDDSVLSRDLATKYRAIFGEEPTSNISVYLKNLIGDGILVRFGRSSPYTYDFKDPAFKVLLRFYPGVNPKVFQQIQNHIISADDWQDGSAD